MIKGAIFDVDGTLLDSMVIWENLGKEYLKSVGAVPRDDLRDALRPLSCSQSAHYMKNEYSLPFSVQKITNDIKAMISEFYNHEAKLKEGVRELLEHLNCLGIKICIATASDAHLIKTALEREEVLHYFDKIFTCEEIGKSKSYPDVYEAALSHIGCSKDECMVFEDSYHALCTAKKAGFRVSGVYDSFEPQWKKVKSECEFWYETLKPPYKHFVEY